CKDWGTFLLLGGIGFDQIPAVRQWAEQNHMLYLHHIATIEGSAGLRYSFSALPTVEQVGTWLGQLAVQRFRGQKVGILYRQSSNWTPGVSTFEKVLKSAGMHVVGSYGVTINQGNYTQELTQLHTAGAQVVLAWDNALAEIEMIKQAQAQNWHPAWLVNGFNIITNTLGSTALDQQMWSAAEWDAYDPGYYGGGFASYAPQIKEFEREYKQYDPKADLKGDGGDLLFLNWESQKWLHDLLLACGAQCTRNKLAGLMLAGWHKITPPNCAADFNHTGDHHHAGFEFNVLHAVRDPNGRPNFVPVNRCVTGL
ncbi:MAG TPA: ABC transporter substrate-binding protein, partial [Dehalococcoidia bacterium]|nr:ABC transporter substrate-binding protein [Dehalococcoidia bacterium]